jgi:hypothetical protein
MARTINTIKSAARMVDVLCTDTDKIAKAEVISHDKSRLVIEMPTGQRIIMTPYPSKPTMYVGQLGPLELTCSPGSPKI